MTCCMEATLALSDLLVKMSKGQELTPIERQQMLLEVRAMEEVTNLVKSIISPGSRILTVDGLVTRNATIESATTGNGDVTLDTEGIFIKNNQEASFSFENSSGDRGTINMHSGLSNEFSLTNWNEDGEIIFRLNLPGDTDPALTSFVRIYEDPDYPDMLRVKVVTSSANNNGVSLHLSNKDALTLYGAEDTTGSTFIRIRGGGSPGAYSTPPDPVQESTWSETNIYVKGGKLIFQYNDAGTVRYKYLDLTGTGVTWVHTTTAP